MRAKLLIGLALLLPQSAFAATEWQVLGVNPDEGRLIAVDAGRVTKAADGLAHIRVFMNWGAAPARGMLGEWAIDCVKHRHRVTSAKTFDGTGKALAQDLAGTPWGDNPPESLQVRIENFACSGQYPANYEGAKLHGEVPIEESAKFLADLSSGSR